jgi:hypothetical protein
MVQFFQPISTPQRTTHRTELFPSHFALVYRKVITCGEIKKISDCYPLPPSQDVVQLFF